MEGEISSSTNKSLKVFVSTDDSSIKIKKGEQQKVIYHLEWLDEGPNCLNLTIAFGMKDGNNIQWENDSVIDVVELDKTTHTLSVDCTQENFTLTFEGLDN